MNIGKKAVFLLNKDECSNKLLESVLNRHNEAVSVIRQKDPAFYQKHHKLFSSLKDPHYVWNRHITFFKDNGQKITPYITVVFHNVTLGPPKGGIMLMTPQIFGEEFFETFENLKKQKVPAEEIQKFYQQWVTEEIFALSIITTLKLSLYSLPLGGGMCGVFLGNLEGLEDEMYIKSVDLTKEEQMRLFREIGYLLTKEGIMGYDTYSPGPDIGTDSKTMDALADGHFRALAEMENIEDKELLEKLKNIKEREVIWTSNLSYLRTANKFSIQIRKQKDTKRAIPELGAVTSKTYGGLKGRVEATAFAAVEITNSLIWYNENSEDYLKLRIGKEKKNYLNGKEVIIQGFGNVGLNAAKLFSTRGAKVIAVSEYDSKRKQIVALKNKQGLNIDELIQYKNNEKSGSLFDFSGAKLYPEPHLLLEDKTDILFLAAIENQINAHNARKIKARYVISAANEGITQEGYHILRENGIIVGRDSLVKSGGIIGSYLEKIQNAQNDTWKRDEVLEDISVRIENVLKNNVIKNQVEIHGIDLSIAGDVLAVKRIISTMASKSLQEEKRASIKSKVIGVFDSGQGGVIVAQKLNKLFSKNDVKILLFTDKANFPFGPKSKKELNDITFQAVKEINERCMRLIRANTFFHLNNTKIPYFFKTLLLKLGIISKNIVICFACNTVDTVIDYNTLQRQYPHIQFIGPVHNTISEIKKLKSRVSIGVIGTTGTKKSGIYEKHLREAGFKVIVKATPLLAVLTEMLYEKSFETEQKQKEFYIIARGVILANLEEFIRDNNITHLCLACTHYDYLKATIKDLFRELQFISTAECVVNEVQNILNRWSVQEGKGYLEFINKSKKGRDFDRLLLEGIILSPNLKADEKVKLSESENELRRMIFERLEDLKREEIEKITFYDKDKINIRIHGKERLITLA